MKLLKEFTDDSINNILKTRNTARAFVVDELKRIALLNCSGEYKGKEFRFYITPGGGIEGTESEETAVKREVMEEIGYGCNILHEVGIIIDYYSDEGRKTISSYYIVEPTEKKQVNWTESESQSIKEIEWVDIEVAEKILSNMPEDPIGQIIQRRDLYALMEAKKIMNL